MDDIRPTYDPYLITCYLFCDHGLGFVDSGDRKENKFIDIVRAADRWDVYGTKYPKTTSICWRADAVAAGLTPKK